MWWELSVPIVYTRLVEWLRLQNVWDGGLLPRGFDSLRISNAKFITISKAQSLAGDESNQKRSEIKAGFVNLKRKKKRKQIKVGREVKELSTDCPELAAFVFALCDTPVTAPACCICATTKRCWMLWKDEYYTHIHAHYTHTYTHTDPLSLSRTHTIYTHTHTHTNPLSLSHTTHAHKSSSSFTRTTYTHIHP